MRAPFSGVLTGPVPQAPPRPSTLGRNFGVTLALAILLGLAARVIELRPLELLRDIGNVGLFVKGYLHPSFTHIGVYAWQCVVTVCIALWGTLLAVVIAVPLGLCGARNLSPHPIVSALTRALGPSASWPATPSHTGRVSRTSVRLAEVWRDLRRRAGRSRGARPRTHRMGSLAPDAPSALSAMPIGHRGAAGRALGRVSARLPRRVPVSRLRADRRPSHHGHLGVDRRVLGRR
jgi:hypothetical protein